MAPVRIPAKSLSFSIGLLSLGAETLWVRTYAFLGESTPKAVALVLGVYLIGIALGADVGARLCESRRDRLREVLVASLLSASAVILLSPFALAATVKLSPEILFGRSVPILLAFLPAFLFSISFPICHHLGTSLQAGQIGKSMSRVYAANIAGSVAGPLLVNFVVLQFATTQLAFALIGLLGATLGTAFLAYAAPTRALRLGAAACALISGASIAASTGPRNWLIESLSASELPVRRVVETRQGIIVAYRDDGQGDTIFGGNVYDGRTNLDVRLNSNGINRILVLAALRPKPRRVLVIGLSIGSWSYLINGFPGVEEIDAIEINPGYLDLIRDYPAQSRALADPRVRLHIGDGRKFLRSVASGSYDLVVMNTTWHWRAYISLLLSREYLTLLSSRLAPGGLLAFNTTWSPDALHTAASVFPHAYLYDNFAICADYDWRRVLSEPASVDALLQVRPEGRPLLTDADRPLARDFLSVKRTATAADLARKAGRPLEVITDRNLVTEYRYGR